jgi:predicted ATPase with chaperone activity
MGVADVRVHCVLDDAGRSLMKAAMSQLQLSARAFHRVLKLSRTIADPSTSPSTELGGTSGQAWPGVMPSR